MTFHKRMLWTAVSFAAWAALIAIQAGAAVASSPAACDVPSVVARALPAIVNITVVKVLNANSVDEGMPANAEGPNARSSDAGAAATDPSGSHFATFVGSGVIINPAGVILTNKHVIKDAAVIKITFSNQTQVPAQLIAAASLVDLAVLKVNVPEPLPTLQFGNSEELHIGQTVIAVGNPLGLGTSVSVGVVSGKGRNLMRSPFDDYIQTDATINPGNSGGPLLDCAGHFVGIDTALLSNSKVLGSIGIGFALPSDLAQFVTSKLLYPAADRPNWIGVHLQTITPRLATIFGLPNMNGAIVAKVTPGSPAADADIQPGDIITGADGHTLDSAAAIMRFVVMQPLGTPISLLLWRDDKMQDAVVSGKPWPDLRALRGSVLASPASVLQAQAAGIGLHLAPMTAAHEHNGGAKPPGVLVDRVTPDSQAAAVGVTAGDVIERVDQRTATTPEQVMDQLTQGSKADGDDVALLLHDKAGTRWITLYTGRIYVAGLLAKPLIPEGFGPANVAGTSVP